MIINTRRTSLYHLYYVLVYKIKFAKPFLFFLQNIYFCRKNPPGEKLTEKFNITITRRDVATLAGLNWLNDEVINFYMNLIMERAQANPKKYPTVRFCCWYFFFTNFFFYDFFFLRIFFFFSTPRSIPR